MLVGTVAPVVALAVSFLCGHVQLQQTDLTLKGIGKVVTVAGGPAAVVTSETKSCFV